MYSLDLNNTIKICYDEEVDIGSTRCNTCVFRVFGVGCEFIKCAFHEREDRKVVHFEFVEHKNENP